MMTILNRLRGRNPSPAKAGPMSQRDEQSTLYADIFLRILAAARHVHETTGMNRADALFDRHLGAVLAKHCVQTRPAPSVLRMITAVLLSHCGYDAALMFVLKLTDEGIHFGVTIGPDILISCEDMSDPPHGTADVFALAAACAKRADLAHEAGPFRGFARILWDAGYSGLPRSNPIVAGALADLAGRVACTWALQPPPEAVAPAHPIGIPMR